MLGVEKAIWRAEVRERKKGREREQEEEKVGGKEERRKEGRREKSLYFPTLSHILFEAGPEQETIVTAH